MVPRGATIRKSGIARKQNCCRVVSWWPTHFNNYALEHDPALLTVPSFCRNVRICAFDILCHVVTPSAFFSPENSGWNSNRTMWGTSATNWNVCLLRFLFLVFFFSIFDAGFSDRTDPYDLFLLARICGRAVLFLNTTAHLCDEWAVTYRVR